MTDNLIQFEGGDVLANLDERTITGLLIPFGEVGRTNVGRFQVEASAVELPADPAVISLNLDHDRTQVVGRATRVWEEPRGVMATFSIAKTPAGDAALADALSPTGKRRKFSGEFGPAVIKAGKLLAGHAKLWGSAVVEAGAFPSAQVLAADTPDPDEASQTSSTYQSEFTDENGVTWRRVEESTTTTDGVTTVTESTVTTTTEAAPAEGNPEGESNVTATAAGATTPPVPQVLASAAPVPPTQIPGGLVVTDRAASLQQVLAAFAAVKSNPSDGDAAQVLAALTDVTIGGSNALPSAGVLQPNWLGQLYQGIPYVREYINLGTLGTNISAAGKKGFKVNRGTSGAPIANPAGIPQGGSWAGNKTEINSYNGFTQTAASFMRRFAVGHDTGREFYDLPGGEEVIAAFLKLVIEDHLYWSDMWALYDLTSLPGAPIAAATYPTDYPAALGMLIQGILAVKARKSDGRRDVPTYALVNDEAYSQLVYAAGGAEHLPAFVNIAVSTNSGGTVDGAVEVVNGDTGITGSASVQVGAKASAEFDELAGGPLIIDALDLARGGVDRAVHGYLQTFSNRPEANVLVGTPGARANSTVYKRGTLFKASSTVYRVTGITATGQENNPVGAGTSASAAPTAPAVGATVADGDLVLTRLA